MLQYLEGKKVVCGNTYIMSPKGVGGYVYVHKVVFTVPMGGLYFIIIFFFCLHSVCLHINTNVLSYVCSWAYVSKVLMLEKHW